MNEEEDYFDGIVGQDSAKTRLKFLLLNYKKTFRLPSVLVLGGFGSGKTILSRKICHYLFDKDSPNKIKLFIEIHGNQLQSEADVFDKLVIPFLSQGNYSIFIDEIHCAGTAAQETFLKLLPNQGNVTKYHYCGIDYEIDLTRHSFIAASTEGNQLLNTFISRFEVIELEEYENVHLEKIFQKNLNKPIDKEILNKIIEHVKNNPRAVYNLARNVHDYLIRENKKRLTMEEWSEIKHGLQLRPKGLDSIQIKIMKILQANPQGSSLGKIASMLELTPDATRKFHELYLMKLGYLNVRAGSGRTLSSTGYRYLADLDKDKISHTP